MLLRRTKPAKDLLWLAGILEGEGTFALIHHERNVGTPRVQMRSADRDVIERVVKIVGQGKVGGPYRKTGAAPHHAPMWGWIASSKESLKLMSVLFPHMCLRRREQISKVFISLGLPPP